MENIGQYIKRRDSIFNANKQFNKVKKFILKYDVNDNELNSYLKQFIHLFTPPF